MKIIICKIYIFSDNCLINDAGATCKIPFSYSGKQYSSCTKAGNYDTPWCYDKRGSGYWDYCSNCRIGIVVQQQKRFNIAYKVFDSNKILSRHY